MRAPEAPRSSLPPRPWSRRRVAFVALGMFVAMLCAPSLSDALPLPRRVDRGAVRVKVALASLALGLPGILGLLWIDARRRKRFVGFALRAAGLTTESYMLRGLQGSGLVAGRPMRAFWLPPQRYAPSSLDLHVESHVGARLVAKLAAGVRHGAPGMRDVPVSDLGLDHVGVTADDVAWARGLLGDATARQAVLALATPVAGEARWMSVEPGAVHLRIAGIQADDITPGLLVPATVSLDALASAAERATPPSVPAQPTSLEVILRTRRNLGMVVAAVALGLLVLLAGGGAVVALLASRSGR